jgi:hypothetical protein
VDGEMQVKEEFRGKLGYLDEPPAGNWTIGIAISEVPSKGH